jgi:hypothetical protein
MRLFNRKSQLQRLLETVSDSLDASTSGIKSRLPSGDSANDTEGWPDRCRQPCWSHGRERRHLFAQARQRGGERRFVKRCAQAMLPPSCAAAR